MVDEQNPEYSSYGVFFYGKEILKRSVLLTDFSTTEAEVIFSVSEKCLSWFVSCWRYKSGPLEMIG